MRARTHAAIAFALVALLVGGCAAPQRPAGSSQSQGEGQQPASVKRIVLGMLGEPPHIWDDVNPSGGTTPGISVLESLVSAGLSTQDENGLLRAQLAPAVPSVDNGLWKVFPDGRMETTWQIRPGAVWHDGVPFTTEDLLFSVRVGQDKEVAVFGNPAFNVVDTIEAIDSQTITVKWKRPYIRADSMFMIATGGFAPPLPKHLLERPFTEDKALFLEQPYWTHAFISTGPFKLREWAPSSHVVVDAFDQYVLGRPRIDQIEVRMIPDPSALVANLLAGAVDLTLPRGITLEQGLQIRDQWKDGRMGLRVDGWTMMYPQIRAPTPPAIQEAAFRRALTHAIDRQEMADSIMPGMPVAHSIMAPSQPEYPHIESGVVRYEYDPRRAVQLIEGIGLAKGPDGFYRDSAGRRISVEIRTTTNDANQKSTFAVADFWQRIGVGAEPYVIPVQQLQAREFRATYPGYELINQPNGVSGIENLLHSSSAPLPERNYQAPASSRNRGQYVNPEYDGLMDRYRMTIPMRERMQILTDIVRHQTDLQLVVGLFYTADAIMITKRLQNIPPGSSWNAHEWELS